MKGEYLRMQVLKISSRIFLQLFIYVGQCAGRLLCLSRTTPNAILEDSQVGTTSISSLALWHLVGLKKIEKALSESRTGVKSGYSGFHLLSPCRWPAIHHELGESFKINPSSWQVAFFITLSESLDSRNHFLSSGQEVVNTPHLCYPYYSSWFPYTVPKFVVM